MSTELFAFEADVKSAFVVDPNSHQGFGYVTALAGLGLDAALKPDLQVTVHYSGTPKYKGIAVTSANPATPSAPRIATVVGVIGKFIWGGAPGDPIQINFWCSQENATQLKLLQQGTLVTNKINQLGWWIANYDQETKEWFEQSYPTTGHITGSTTVKSSPELQPFNLRPDPVEFGTKQLYQVALPMTPTSAAPQPLTFATSPTKPVVLPWGIEVGSLA